MLACESSLCYMKHFEIYICRYKGLFHRPNLRIQKPRCHSIRRPLLSSSLCRTHAGARDYSTGPIYGFKSLDAVLPLRIHVFCRAIRSVKVELRLTKKTCVTSAGSCRRVIFADERTTTFDISTVRTRRNIHCNEKNITRL